MSKLSLQFKLGANRVASDIRLAVGSSWTLRKL